MTSRLEPPGTDGVLRLLAIDDERNLLALYSYWAAKLDRRTGRGRVAIDTATSVAEGLRRFQHDPPHLVLLDFELGDGTALDWLRRAEPAATGARVVIVSGRDDRDRQARAFALGANDWRQKPLDFATFTEMIDAVEKAPVGVEDPAGPQSCVVVAADAEPIDALGEACLRAGLALVVAPTVSSQHLSRDLPPVVLMASGDQLIGQVRELRQRPGGDMAVLVAVTGHDDTDTHRRLLEAGADDWMVQPLRAEAAALRLEIFARIARRRAERRRSDEQRLEAEEALRASEERYALAARAASDGLWDWDLRAQRIFFSDGWRAILGLAETPLSDGANEWFDRVHGDDLDRLRQALDAYLDGHADKLDVEYRMLDQAGAWRWVLSRAIAVRDAGGRPYRMVGSLTDVTDERIHDPLTGLPNRRLLFDRIERAIARRQRAPSAGFALLLIALDRHSVVTESFGHAAGDRLLSESGRRLEECSRSGDTLARLGGGEFVLLLEDVRDVGDAIQVARRVHHRFEDEFEIDGHRFVATTSIGIVWGEAVHEEPSLVLRDAGVALLRARARGSGRHEIFEADMHSHALRRFGLETELRRSVGRAELQVHFQPIVALSSGRIDGFEALLRWRSPGRGLVAPADFIPVAEESGLIVEIGEFVLREACREAMRWKDSRGDHPRLAVNLSSRQLTDPGLVPTLVRILAETGFPAQRLELEITESAIMSDLDRAGHCLRRIRELGVRLALDDFGTGYSSLSYLQRFPIDALKIDRSFVDRMGAGGETPQIVRAIVGLAHDLALEVVAEGIETTDQLATLRELGCERGQGHLFSAAIDSAASLALLERQQQSRLRWHGVPALDVEFTGH